MYKQKSRGPRTEPCGNQSAKVKMKKHENQWIHVVNDFEGMTRVERESRVGDAKVR